MKILAIDTSCDETASSVTEETKILSNVVWSQSSLHAKWGGILPSLAQRMHEERIDWIIKRALGKKDLAKDIDAIAVTTGPGLSIALGVGVNKAKDLAIKYKKKLIQVNHIEAHLLSPIANADKDIKFPAYALCVSGGNTIFILIEKIGKYKVLAQTVDDALGEALDKGARLLGLGYPGGAILEKFAKLGNPKVHYLPVPLMDDKIKNRFSYSGLKTAFVRLVSSLNNLSKEDIYNLSATYQNIAFEHLIRVIDFQISNLNNPEVDTFLLGGGVAANVELKKRIRKLCRKHNLKLLTPYSKRICGDNAGMIGVCAYLNPKYISPSEIDRFPRLAL